MSRDRKCAQLIDSIFDHPRYAHVIIIINVVAKRNCLLPELYARKIMNKVKKVISLILESPEYLLDTLQLIVHITQINESNNLICVFVID